MEFKSDELSGMAYMHERIQESRQNEIISYLMFIAGTVFFIGGVLATVNSNANPNWFLFIPYTIGPQVNNFVNLFMVLNGFMLLIVGLSACLYYNVYRSSYLNLVNDIEPTKKQAFDDRGTKAFGKELMNAQTELGECKTYIMNSIGLDERESIYYCKLLGKHWHELAEEEKLFETINDYN